MSTPTFHNFTDSLIKSHGVTDAPWWEEVYRRAFPTFMAMNDIRQDGWAQRGGIDRLVHLRDGTTYKVDEKARFEAYNDILLEYWSDRVRKTPGWACKDDLTCDFIAYAIEPLRACYLLPFRTLRRAWDLHGQTWITRGQRRTRGYRIVEASNRSDDGRRGWVTESVVIPISVLKEALGDAIEIHWYGEHPPSSVNGGGTVPTKPPPPPSLFDTVSNQVAFQEAPHESSLEIATDIECDTIDDRLLRTRAIKDCLEQQLGGTQ